MDQFIGHYSFYLATHFDRKKNITVDSNIQINFCRAVDGCSFCWKTSKLNIHPKIAYLQFCNRKCSSSINTAQKLGVIHVSFSQETFKWKIVSFNLIYLVKEEKFHQMLTFLFINIIEQIDDWLHCILHASYTSSQCSSWWA